MSQGKELSPSLKHFTMDTTYDSPIVSPVAQSRRRMLIVGFASSAVTAALCLATLPGLNSAVSTKRFRAGSSTAPVSIASPQRYGTGRGMAAHPRSTGPVPLVGNAPSAAADGTPPAATVHGPRGRGAAFLPH
jgi:hypothetical protein